MHHISDIPEHERQSRKRRLVVLPDDKMHGRFLPDLPRSLDKIKKPVKDKLREVVTGKSKWPIYMYGDTGVGKTRAVLALTDRVWQCWYRLAMDLPPYWESDHYVWREIGRRNLVVIDDIGVTASDTDLCNLLKVGRREYKPTIYVGNHPPDALAELFDDRIQNRICSGTVIHYPGESRR